MREMERKALLFRQPESRGRRKNYVHVPLAACARGATPPGVDVVRRVFVLALMKRLIPELLREPEAADNP